jgi:UDP-N-acetylmuramate--alanine ligase
MYPRTTQHIHFIGIGGIGMSGIAMILSQQGYRISGCDRDPHQQSVSDLLMHGCVVHTGNNTSECHDDSIDIVVYSSAIQPNNPEIQRARNRGIPTIQRASMLAEIMRTKFSIAIAGAHGKTTTTSMISHILLEAQLDPTIIVGGHVKNLSTNARLGQGDLLVAEADESDRSFLKLYPAWAVVTNIDLEHIDVYHDLDEIKQAFQQFLGNLPFYGKAFLSSDDEHIQSLLPLHQIKTVSYGLSEHADIRARDILTHARYSTCTIWRKHDNVPLGSLYLTMPGIHNIQNATAATAVALNLGVPFSTITQALAHFSGVERRFSYRGNYKGAELFDDYGHHPTEIDRTLTVARKRSEGRLIVAFQPHRYSRTQGLWQDFISVFTLHKIDHLIITDVYAASEAPIAGITGERLAQEMQQLLPTGQVTYTPQDDQWSSLCAQLNTVIKPHDLVLFLGAGKINQAACILR